MHDTNIFTVKNVACPINAMNKNTIIIPITISNKVENIQYMEYNKRIEYCG